AGTGASGPHLLELVTLPPLGFATAALPAKPWSTALPIGLAAFGPLAFVEPVQTSPLLGLRDVGFWAAVAAAAALAVAVLFRIGYGLSVRDRVPRKLAVALVAVLLAGDLVGYLGFGRPGFHGDRLFVVMAVQADLRGVAGIADVRSCRAEVYRRLVATAQR